MTDRLKAALQQLNDDDMEVLWTALWRMGRRSEASSMLRHYLVNARREQRDASFMLKSRTREDPVWEELGRTNASMRPTMSRF